MDSLQDLRKNYTKKELTEDSLEKDPIQQFQKWFDDVLKSTIHEPNAVMVSTVDIETNQPSSRVVLLKGVENNEFHFFTNYNSKKGKELAVNPKISLLFYWGELERQVRIEGEAKKMSVENSEAYWKTRPRGSQIGAWSSPQSQEIESREILTSNVNKYEEEFKDVAIPKPEHWGGIRVIPTTIEFWQGWESRLHNRFLYTFDKTQQTWEVVRLAP